MDINDTPIAQVEPPIKAADAFEHWLQGRINLCVAGLQDQITRLEIRCNELEKQAYAVEDKANVNLSEEFNTLMMKYIDYGDMDSMLAALKNSLDWGDAVAEVYGTTEFEDAIGEALTNSSAMEDAVKEIIKDKVSFSVTVD